MLHPKSFCLGIYIYIYIYLIINISRPENLTFFTVLEPEVPRSVATHAPLSNTLFSYDMSKNSENPAS